MSREYETWLIFACEDLQMAELAIANKIYNDEKNAIVENQFIKSRSENMKASTQKKDN